MQLLSEASRARYRGFVHDDPGFFEFFQAVTPVDVIEHMQIGSRPLVRGSGSGVDTIRAVPWMFAWSQSRHMLPGWFGAGTGLAAVIDAHGQALVEEMYRDWPFFAGLLDDVEMRLARADMDIAWHYERLYPGDVERYSKVIRQEYELTRRLVLQFKGCARLLDAEPTLQRSIWLRNPYVDPIHLMQVHLVRRWREAGSPNGKVRASDDPDLVTYWASQHDGYHSRVVHGTGPYGYRAWQLQGQKVSIGWAPTGLLPCHHAFSSVFMVLLSFPTLEVFFIYPLHCGCIL